MNSPAVSDTWLVGSPYEQYIGRWSRRIAPLFLQWLAAGPGKVWLDVGCGTGAVSAAIAHLCAPAEVIGVEPSEGFLKLASQNLAGTATLLAGSATALPLPDASVDVVVSGLVLNFIPDTAAALAEMRRVARPGGLLAAYVWDYADQMELIRIFWDAAAARDEQALALHEGRRFPICAPDALRDAFASAGLVGIEVTALDAVADFASFEDYWQPFLGGQGPAPAYAMSLTEAARSALKDAVRGRVPTAADGSVRLNTRAWGIRAAMPGAA